MLWDSTKYGGFSAVQPWCAQAARAEVINVDVQKNEPSALLNLYRRLIKARRNNRSLAIGRYTPLVANGDILLYMRSQLGCPAVLVALNLGDQPVAAVLREKQMHGRVIVSVFADREGEIVRDAVDLRPDEGLVIELVRPSAGPG
jgi:alpha-glucosidase